MPKSDKSPVVAILLLCIVVGAGAVAYVKFAPADEVIPEVEQEQQSGGSIVRVLSPYWDSDHNLKFTVDQKEVPKDEDEHVYVVNNYLKQAGFLPEGAEAKSVTIENGTATIDFTAPFNSSYGTEDEATVVNGILTVMGQFKEVNYVKMTVEGSPLEALGNLDLIDPLPVLRLREYDQPLSSDKTAKS